MAIKYCWATNRRGSSLKVVMKLCLVTPWQHRWVTKKEIGHDQSLVRVTLLDRQKNTVVCKTENEPELCNRWIIPGRQSPQVSRHINSIKGLGPQHLLIKGPKALDCLQAKPKSHVPWEPEIQFLE